MYSQVLGTIYFQGFGTRYLVPGTWYQVFGPTWYQVLGTKPLVPGTWNQVLGTRYLVRSIWYQVLYNIYTYDCALSYPHLEAGHRT